jgi:hypothetical protein
LLVQQIDRLLRQLAALVVLPWVLVAGCKNRDRSAASPTPSASANPQPLASRAVAGAELGSATAFTLVARAGGLRLLWASSQAGAGWLHELELRPDGQARGAARRLELPARGLARVTDLGASAAGESLALAWLEQGEREARAQAALLDEASPPTLLDLGPAARVAAAARGNIAIAAEPARASALVMWRGLESACVGSHAGPCTGFSFRRLRAGQAEPTGLPLSVPVPCASHSVELATAQGRFHYGVCTREGAEPVTTMFSIQYNPEYARAEPLLKGCLPLGTIDVDDRAWLVGDCKGRRRAVMVPLADERVEPESIDAPLISCTAQRAELSQGRFRLALGSARAGLEAVLPPMFAPTGARVGWTGSTLVAAYANGASLETRTFACRAGKLVPSP